MDIKQEEITTLHGLSVNKNELLKSISDIVSERPVSVVMPMLYKEIKSDALGTILKGLNKCDYLKEVVIPLAANTEAEFERVKRFFSKLAVPKLVIWCNGPKIEKLLSELKEEGLDFLMYKGKGRDVWLALGIASLNSYAIVLHDADIYTYDELFPAKLAYPILEPELGFKFNKGYYARISSDKNVMYGRAFRLFLHPLLQALIDEIGFEPDFITFLRSFRYPLSGEFALTSDLSLDVDIPYDWGLEIGILAEMYRNVAKKRICQTDLGLYEHKHQRIGDSKKGLNRMTMDILKTLLRVLIETDHIQISQSFLTSLLVLYRRKAQDCIRQYHADAHYNNLEYDRHLEETIVERFSKSILTAGAEYIEKPVGTRLPDWLRTMSAKKKIRKRLLEIVMEDNAVQ